MIENPVVGTILERRSIRDYRPDQISEEELTGILTAARYAPSAMGEQRRHFTVIQDKRLMQDIVEATQRLIGNFHAGHVPFFGAPTIVVLSAPDWKYAHEDTACSLMNLMLAAHSIGIGSCFIGSVTPGLCEKTILPRLELPEGYMPYACATLGYAAQAAPAPIPRREDDVNYICG